LFLSPQWYAYTLLVFISLNKIIASHSTLFREIEPKRYTTWQPGAIQ
jgi:hypothetical protein